MVILIRGTPTSLDDLRADVKAARETGLILTFTTDTVAGLIEKVEELAAQHAAPLDACRAAHSALYHHDLVRQHNGVDWGDVDALRLSLIDQLWRAICLAQPELDSAVACAECAGKKGAA